MPRLIQSEDGTTVCILPLCPKIECDGRVTTAPMLLAVGVGFFLSLGAEPCTELEQFIRKSPDVGTTDRARTLLDILKSCSKRTLPIKCHKIEKFGPHAAA